MYWGGAEAAVAAEAGRGVNPLYTGLPNGRSSREETLKESQSPYFGTLTIGAMVSGESHGRGDREVYQKAGVVLPSAGALSFE